MTPDTREPLSCFLLFVEIGIEAEGYAIILVKVRREAEFLFFP